MTEAIAKLAEGLEAAKEADLLNRYPNLAGKGYDAVSVRPRKKFTAIDFGTSGAFLVDNETGELYNIKSYGRPDYNKKKKADIGNVYTADPAKLFTLRYNYLR